MQLILLAMGCLAWVSSDTTVVLGSRSVDLTGDGQAEILEVIGTQRSPDSLEVNFVIRSARGVLYEASLAPLKRTVGFDAGARRLSVADYQDLVDGYGEFFFSVHKFKTATEFENQLRRSAPRHVSAIPDVIARDSEGSSDRTAASKIWDSIKLRGGTVFEYSPGGDAIVAIAWSRTNQRFYGLIECC